MGEEELKQGGLSLGAVGTILVGMSWYWRFFAWLVLGMACAGAQEPASDEALGPIHTLHVYMDLIQVPVLVLDREHERMKPLKPGSFFVSLDDGPVFRPKNVRQEGDDPITLGILLDPNGENELMAGMSDAIAALAPKSLRPADHVTLYAMDCGLLRSLEDVPASTAVLKSGVDRGLAKWMERRKKKEVITCAKPIGLWDSMILAVNELGKLPGRRVLLVVSNGVDGNGGSGGEHAFGERTAAVCARPRRGDLRVSGRIRKDAGCMARAGLRDAGGERPEGRCVQRDMPVERRDGGDGRSGVRDARVDAVCDDGARAVHPGVFASAQRRAGRTQHCGDAAEDESKCVYPGGGGYDYEPHGGGG